MKGASYDNAKNILRKASSDIGFLASANNISNYKRVWSRDGVICGLAALIDGDETLIATFKKTLLTLMKHQNEIGHIPSNVYYDEVGNPQVSYGGLAGRVDTISWYIIGVCNYASITKDKTFFKEAIPSIDRGLRLLQAWEFNDKDLIYVPRSGNWADEYITEGHILYDQLLRLWALRCYVALEISEKTSEKIKKVTQKIEDNYKRGTTEKPYHPRAYKELKNHDYWMASITPSGYQTMYDGFGNSLALLLGVGENNFQERVISYSETLRKSLPLQLIPAFWEPIVPGQTQWELLKDNCAYEFRNHPYEFHNGGTWQMVNAFYGMAVMGHSINISEEILKEIEILNAVEDNGFYENFNSKTGKAIGVKECTWSAAGQLLLKGYITGKRLLV